MKPEHKRLINGEEKNIFDLKNSFFFHGFSVFTTFLSFDRTPLFLEQHLDRLQNHTREIGLHYPGNQLFLSDLKQLLTRGVLRIRLCVCEHGRISEATDFTPYPSKHIIKGINAVVTPFQVHPNFAHLKTGNYLPYLMAKQYAQDHNAFEGLLTDKENNIVDGSKSSPLLYKNNTLTALKGGLEGITRQMVIKHSLSLKLKVKHSFIKTNELDGQLLLSGSGIGLIPVGAPVDHTVKHLIESFYPNQLLYPKDNSL